nr:MAG TPA: hypothetical protein [Caudoviricetes sp.]
MQCVEHTINGRWAGSRPGFRFDSGCVRFAYLPPGHRRGREYSSIMCTECCVASGIITRGKQ